MRAAGERRSDRCSKQLMNKATPPAEGQSSSSSSRRAQSRVVIVKASRVVVDPLLPRLLFFCRRAAAGAACRQQTRRATCCSACCCCSGGDKTGRSKRSLYGPLQPPALSSRLSLPPPRQPSCPPQQKACSSPPPPRSPGGSATTPKAGRKRSRLGPAACRAPAEGARPTPPCGSGTGAPRTTRRCPRTSWGLRPEPRAGGWSARWCRRRTAPGAARRRAPTRSCGGETPTGPLVERRRDPRRGPRRLLLRLLRRRAGRRRWRRGRSGR